MYHSPLAVKKVNMPYDENEEDYANENIFNS